MRRKRSMGVLSDRERPQANADQQTFKPPDNPSHTTTRRDKMSRIQHTLFGLGLILLASMLIIGIAIALSNASPSSTTEEIAFKAQNDAAMSKMMTAMQIKPSHNIDQDFVALMVPHHQGAIDMAKAELSYGHDETLRNLAQGIIVSQQEDIATMKLIHGNIAPSSKAEEMAFKAQNDAAMSKMMTAMQIKPSHNIDQDFVALMVPHHQGAIDMAKAELSYGHDETLRGLAQEIIATQQQEITALQLEESNLPPSSGLNKPAINIFDQ